LKNVWGYWLMQNGTGVRLINLPGTSRHTIFQHQMPPEYGRVLAMARLHYSLCEQTNSLNDDFKGAISFRARYSQLSRLVLVTSLAGILKFNLRPLR
jgi:hypothetical protein